MKTRSLAVTVLAVVLTGAGPEKAPTVYVRLFRSQSFGRPERLVLTERVIKGIEHRTPYKVVASPDGADVILDGSFSADAEGGLNLTAGWTDTRADKAVSVRTVVKPAPADVSGQAEVLSELVVDGTKLLRRPPLSAAPILSPRSR